MADAPNTFRAIPCRFPSDAMVVTREGDELVYRRAQGGEPYSYKKPFILELEITRRCNLRCIHCYAEAEDRVFDSELTLDEIRRVLDDAAALGMRELSLTGGEVFLRPDFLDIFDAGLQRGFDVRFVTNGTLLDDALLEGLCARPVKLITVSLDSISPAAHERISGKGSHLPTVENILRLRQAGFTVSVITAFSTFNLGDFDDLFAFCLENRMDWQVQMTSAKGRCSSRITLNPDEYYTLGEKTAALYARQLPIHIIPMDDLATFSHFAPLHRLAETWQGMCTGGLLNLFVRANGDVTPCSALAFPECVVGNVRTDSLVDICTEERCRTNLAWLTPETRTGACRACPFVEACRGGCPEILLSMCPERTENRYCYHAIEQRRLLAEFT